VKDSESLPMNKRENSPRIIRYGRLLRASCIDELPQLFNVLRGEMSMVGPRPCLPYEADEYLRWQVRRFDSVPGMTGLWQVMGKNRTTFKDDTPRHQLLPEPFLVAGSQDPFSDARGNHPPDH